MLCSILKNKWYYCVYKLLNQYSNFRGSVSYRSLFVFPPTSFISRLPQHSCMSFDTGAGYILKVIRFIDFCPVLVRSNRNFSWNCDWILSELSELLIVQKLCSIAFVFETSFGILHIWWVLKHYWCALTLTQCLMNSETDILYLIKIRLDMSNGYKIVLEYIWKTCTPSYSYLLQSNLHIKEPQETRFFFCYWQVPFNTGMWIWMLWAPHPWDCKRFLVKTCFCYAQILLKAGFTVFNLRP